MIELRFYHMKWFSKQHKNQVGLRIRNFAPNTINDLATGHTRTRTVHGTGAGSHISDGTALDDRAGDNLTRRLDGRVADDIHDVDRRSYADVARRQCDGGQGRLKIAGDFPIIKADDCHILWNG